MAPQDHSSSSFIRRRRCDVGSSPDALSVRTRPVETPRLDIAPNDPIVAYFQTSYSVVDIDHPYLDFPSLGVMKAESFRLVVVLVSHAWK